MWKDIDICGGDEFPNKAREPNIQLPFGSINDKCKQKRNLPFDELAVCLDFKKEKKKKKRTYLK